MNNIQKSLLGVFGFLFLLPEVLWSPIANFVYAFLKPTINGDFQLLRINFLITSQSSYLYVLVLCLQFLGVVSGVLWVYKSDYSKIVKALMCLLLAVVLVTIGLILYIILYK